MSVRDADKSKPLIPHNTLKNDGWSKEGEATATCYCGAVQLSFVSRLFAFTPCHLSSSLRTPSLLSPPKKNKKRTKQPTTLSNQPTTAPGMLDTFVCHCTDCRKITASAFTAAFIVSTPHVTHVRGQDKLKTFTQAETTHSRMPATNFFCDTCGTLMYRTVGLMPDALICRLGTVDDVHLMEGVMKPRREVFAKDRVSWFHGVEGARVSELME